MCFGPMAEATIMENETCIAALTEAPLDMVVDQALKDGWLGEDWELVSFSENDFQIQQDGGSVNIDAKYAFDGISVTFTQVIVH